MITYDPAKEKTGKIHNILLSSVAPRPIAFASTVDKEGNVNLSPFSFFNAFGAKPPVMVFSPSRRVRDNTTKHTYENIKETMEVVINVVNYAMVHQASLASTEYPKGVNEFVKAGFTPEPSVMVNPPRVKESPVQYECKVLQVIETGTEGGAGNLVVCEAVLIHVSEDILDEEGRIDQDKIDLVARMGGNLYCRASGSALFEVEKPISRHGIGVDQLPERIRYSKVLTGNDLGKLGNVEILPSEDEVSTLNEAEEVSVILNTTEKNENKRVELHKLAQQNLNKGEVNDAWKILLLSEKLLIFLFFIFLSNCCFAQNQNSIWVFGDSAGIDFTNLQNPLPINSNLVSRGTCAAICDNNGQLLFYYGHNPDGMSNGLIYLNGNVYNKNNELMIGGDSVVTSLLYNEGVIIPSPLNSNLYYLFTVGVVGNHGVYYSIIDISQDNGNGAVVQKNIQLENWEADDGIIAIRHGNGKDWWIVAKRGTIWTGTNLNEWYLYLIDSISIHPQPMQIIGSLTGSTITHLTFNTQTNKICFLNYKGLVEIYDFDRCTGIISNPITVHPDFSYTSILE